MPKRFVGSAVVEIRYLGHVAGRDEYAGSIRAGGQVWKFDSLYSPPAGFRHGYDSPEAYDRMSEAAVSFGAYYTSGNRGDDLPDWVPPPETADAINEATINAMKNNGRYNVTRKPTKR
jgi:hypothetical protein